MNRNGTFTRNRKTIRFAGAAAGSALLVAAIFGASPAQAAHNPRPGGQGGPAPQSTTTSTVTATPSTATPSTATPSTATTPAAAATGTASERGPRPGGVPLRSLVGAGTITAEQAHEVRDQLRTDAQAAREQARNTALTTLVSEGELTQAQADAIVAAGRGGLRTLVGNGTLTQDQARAVQAEFAEYGSADTSAASLAALVAAGVLTQEQADAIAALIPAPASGS